MSELREWTADEIEEYDDARLELAEDGKIDCTRVYIKADADEVISTIRAERDEYRYNLSCARNEIHNLYKVIAELEERIADGDNDFDMANSQNERLLKIVRRYKYKRAIDKAKWCKAELWNIRNTPLCDMNTHEIWQHDDEFWQRWQMRWLKIAEQFKKGI